MTKDEQFTKEALKLLKDAGIKAKAFRQYDGNENYAGSTYVLIRSSDDAWADLEDIVELQEVNDDR